MNFRKVAVGILFSVFCVSFVSSLTANEAVTPRQKEIIQTVLAADGFLSQKLHAEFWSLIPAKIRNDSRAIEAMVEILRGLSFAPYVFQREAWGSIKLSHKERRILKTKEYEDAKKAVLSASSLPSYQEAVTRSLKTAEAMIQAAASGKPFETANGPIYFNDEMIEKILNGLDGSFARFNALVKPNWDSRILERRYPDAQVAILSQFPFSVERQTVTGENRRVLNVITLTNRLGEDAFQSVIYTYIGSQFVDLDGALVRQAKGTLEGAGVRPSAILLSEWRGSRSATGNGEGSSSGNQYFVSVRTIALREKLGTLALVVVSGESKIDAALLREQLEQSLKIID